MLSIRRFKSFIPTCPSPSYDTGCTYCETPKFPANKQIDFEKNLNNTKALPWKHLISLTHGAKDMETMPSKIELVPGSLNERLNLLRLQFSPHHPIMISNMIFNNQDEFLNRYKVTGQEQLVMLIPDYKIVKFNIDNTAGFIQRYLIPKEGIRQIYNPFKRKESVAQIEKEIADDPNAFEEHAMERDMIAICGHFQRDIRCGELAPLINEELIRVIDRNQLDIDVGLISHIGGHAYAGNLIYFPLGEDSIWYGRVFPNKVQGIINETVKRKRIIKDMYRGNVAENT
ncbi:uncharacterized protein PRCAT00004779001 [Priceomyces carsonii]|uniref:uncharacterized protein n=1 Tax=Priceomyces carsonii TaxID=28549 RepID=UPI002ED785AB|nr:unnamed protein product [Priceomyces carsonii]